MAFGRAAHQHPYYPTDAVLDGFVPQQLPFQTTLAVFFAAAGAIMAAGWRMGGGYKHVASSNVDRLLLCWFLVCGFIHLVVEGAVVLDAKFYQDTSKNILSEICEFFLVS